MTILTKSVLYSNDYLVIITPSPCPSSLGLWRGKFGKYQEGLHFICFHLNPQPCSCYKQTHPGSKIIRSVSHSGFLLILKAPRNVIVTTFNACQAAINSWEQDYHHRKTSLVQTWLIGQIRSGTYNPSNKAASSTISLRSSQSKSCVNIDLVHFEQ